jgi:hypothetical protein
VIRVVKQLERGEGTYPVFEGWSTCKLRILDVAVSMAVVTPEAMAAVKAQSRRHGGSDVWSVPIMISQQGDIVSVYPIPHDDFDLIEFVPGTEGDHE